MQLIFWIFILLFSFYVLALICDEYFVDSLEKIAKKLKLSPDAAGATLIAVGSSAPELFVSLSALFLPGENTPIGVGTIVGSALFNILVIVGASALVNKLIIQWQSIIRDLSFYFISILLLLWFFSDGQITLFESLTFLIFYIIYVVAVINWKKILPYQSPEFSDSSKNTASEKNQKNLLYVVNKPIQYLFKKIFPKPDQYYLIFFISIIFISIFSAILVEGAQAIGHIIGVPSIIIALIVLAAGTSIPDLMSSIIVARQGYGGMAVSNAIGSNVFDIFIGLGFPWTLAMIIHQKTIVVDNNNLAQSILILFSTIILLFAMFFIEKWKLGKKSGFILIGIYVLYLLWTLLKAF